MLVSEGQLWWSLAVALAAAAFSGVTFARSDALHGHAYLTFWLSMTAAWAMGGAFFAVEARHRTRWITAGPVAGLLLPNSPVAFVGGWLLALVTWFVLSVLLLSNRAEALSPRTGT